ncbi:MAG: triose-phosphate isomerase [Candidatus Gottesmanbacteria bacterium]|nr:triose-phosphate isomerase [Candidatus Gottesmanbacteria bacterium]
MKPLVIAGNWKSNKTTAEALRWLQDFKSHIALIPSYITVVLCVPFTLLYTVKEVIKADSLPLVLGAQNVSPFAEGAETGEESARMVRDLADWVIIGHSERRKNFGETDGILAQKIEQAKNAGLKIIYCVPDDRTGIPKGVDVVAYEPVCAIGTGESDTPGNANSVIANIKAKSQVSTVIYGGSVTATNVASFVTQPAIDGVLPGRTSLDPETFAALIGNTR